jgi:hypothetical protein
MEDGVAFELYWANFSHNDIVRESVGHSQRYRRQDCEIRQEQEEVDQNSMTLKNITIETNCTQTMEGQLR